MVVPPLRQCNNYLVNQQTFCFGRDYGSAIDPVGTFPPHHEAVFGFKENEGFDTVSKGRPPIAFVQGLEFAGMANS